MLLPKAIDLKVRELKEINFLHIPGGIRLISWATAIRYIGWGFFEMFIPVFLLQFSADFLQAGVLRSVYDIVYLAALPVVSRLADKVSSKRLILSGLVMYPVIALGYFFAGVYGAVFFLIAARFINGISFALDSVGRMTYMRRHSPDGRIGVILGYFETLANFWWLAAGVAGLFLIRTIPLHELSLMIIPTVLVAILLVSFIKENTAAYRAKIHFKGFVHELWTDYRAMVRFIWRWSAEQKYIALLYAYMFVAYVIISFFVPLVSFAENHSYSMVFLLTTFSVLPMVFGVPLGILADKANSFVLRRISFLSLCLLVALPFISSFWLTLVVVFLIGLSLNFSMLVLERAATDRETLRHMGSLSGAFLTVAQTAQVIGPICIGFFIDSFSLPAAIWTICLLGFCLIVPLYVRKFRI